MTDLKELFRSAAAEVENVSIDGSALIPAIRRRRRIRSAAVGVGGVTAVTTLAVGAYAVLPGAGEPPVNGGTPAPASQGACPIDASANPPKGPHKVVLTQQTMKRTGYNTWVVTAKITITNTSKVTLYTANTAPNYLVVPEGPGQDENVKGQAIAKVTDKNVVLRPGASHTSVVRLTVEGGCWRSQLAGSFVVYEKFSGLQGLVSFPIGRLQLK